LSLLPTLVEFNGAPLMSQPLSRWYPTSVIVFRSVLWVTVASVLYTVFHLLDIAVFLLVDTVMNQFTLKIQQDATMYQIFI